MREIEISAHWVDVTINDRGPFVRGRDTDLAREAARQLGIIPRLSLSSAPDGSGSL